MRRVLVGLAIAVVASAAPARAGEIVDWIPGSPVAPRAVLPHTPLKGLVAEFMDLGNTGLGKSIGYLVWRETLTAISDQAGAGVILAHPPGDRRIVGMLAQDYHVAAAQVARSQNAKMLVWGGVLEGDGRAVVDAYLTLLPEIGQGPTLGLTFGPRQASAPLLEVEVPRTRFSFAPVETTRKRLFARWIVARRNVPLRSAPDERARPLETVKAGQALRALDMSGEWFEVERRTGEPGFVRHVSVDVPPRHIDVQAPALSLSPAPGATAGAKRETNVAGTFDVLDMRYVRGKGLWYRTTVRSTTGWIPATQARPRFSLPVVHFLAGLYRFQAKRFADATREFSQFVRMADAEMENATLATAHQLLGASALMGKSAFGADPRALAPFDEAVRLTPYDPAAYNVRALVTLAVAGQSLRALQDLEQALALDPDNARARLLVQNSGLAIRQPRFVPLRDDVGASQRKLEAIETKFGIDKLPERR